MYGLNEVGTSNSLWASIFYDANDSGYYTDPNGTNRLNFVHSNNHYIQPGHMLYSDMGGWTGEYNKIQWHSSHLYLQHRSGGYVIMRRNDGLDMQYFASDGNIWSRYWGTWFSNIFNQDVRGGASPTFTEVYANGWFRNNNSGQGLYNQARAMHWYSNNGYWKSAGGGYAYGGIVMYNNYESDLRGYAGYWDGSGFGMLNSSGNWQIRIEYGNANMELYRVTWANDMRAYIFYDRDNTAYYCNPNGFSQMSSANFNNYIEFARLRPIGVGGNSGQGANPYDIFQEGGGWGFPFPDLRIAYHTGIKLGANSSYEGTRIYDDYPMGTIRWQFNGGSGYNYQYTWTNLTGVHGHYSSVNGFHFYPNAGSSYGSAELRGQRSGWYGLFIQTGNLPHLMFDGSGNGGIYHQSLGRWVMYHSVGNNCTGFNTSTTSSAYGMYVSKAIYSTGDVIAFSDARMKENVITITNALEKILQLRGVYFNRIDDEKKKRNIGFIAQEVEKVIPEVVTYADDIDEYGVAYGNITGMLVEAMKEQQQTIENQQKEIDELKEMVKHLLNK
jgi:hypothetical protein